MRNVLVAATVSLLALPLAASAQGTRINPVIDLLAVNKPVFGLYAPRNARNAETQKTPAQLAQEALNYKLSDFIFDGSMEGNFDRTLPVFASFVKGMAEADVLMKAITPRLQQPLIVKMHEIAPDPVKAAEHIAQQLNLGVSGIVFVGVESADEVKHGLAAMRFKSKGGTRPEDVGGAPAYWGITEKEYKGKADIWPLNPRGELLNWVIVESKEGLAHVREIAAVKGVGVLFPGSGTLRSVFTSTDANGQRVFDGKAHEAAIQQVLAACKEFKIACGIPATANDIEMRLQQGFSVFIINWGDAGFKTVEIGRKAAGR